jgi:phospholipase C
MKLAATPDNLFGSAPSGGKTCGSEDPFEPGVDIDNGGYGYVGGTRQEICNIPLPMNDGSLNPNHSHADGWVPQCDLNSSGQCQMDGFCQIVNNGKCQQYSYVQPSDVQPYFAIATNYGFANYFFQTNEGPSFPAHQFLFTGTSAPAAPPNLYFAAELPTDSKSLQCCGCPDTIGTAALIDPTGTEVNPGPLTCYTHDSLVTNSSGGKGVTWRYYTPSQPGIWDAPEAIPEVCYGENNLNNQGQPCGGTEWGNVIFPGTGQGKGAPILTDIANCSLQQISWVIPDEIWSDHPSFDGHNPALGPSWVGDIVNAVGNSYQASGRVCDYWGTGSTNPEPTAIFVVWDDWGGWFDHVPPPDVYRSSSSTSCPTTVQPNGWGCGYVYGFRVPLLVVSEYTKAGYVSGACGSSGCNNDAPPTSTILAAFWRLPSTTSA